MPPQGFPGHFEIPTRGFLGHLEMPSQGSLVTFKCHPRGPWWGMAPSSSRAAGLAAARTAALQLPAVLVPRQCCVCCACRSSHLFPGILVPTRALRQLSPSLCGKQDNDLIETFGRRREQEQGRRSRNKSLSRVNRVSLPQTAHTDSPSLLLPWAAGKPAPVSEQHSPGEHGMTHAGAARMVSGFGLKMWRGLVPGHATHRAPLELPCEALESRAAACELTPLGGKCFLLSWAAGTKADPPAPGLPNPALAEPSCSGHS